MAKKHYGISLVVPAHNERDNLPLLMSRIYNTLEPLGLPYEVIIVDDYSTDNTYKKILSLKKKYCIVPVKNTGKAGKAYAVILGLSKAQYSIAGMLDADGEYPPEVIPHMLKKLGKSDICIANRVKTHKNKWRAVASRVFHKIFVQLLHGIDADVQSGLKLFKKKILSRINLNPKPWTFDLEFVVQAMQLGYRVSTVPINFGKRSYGSSKVKLIASSIEIGSEAVKMWFKKQWPLEYTFTKKGKPFRSFAVKGKHYIHHSRLHFKDSAFATLFGMQKTVLFILLAAIGAALYINFSVTLITLIAIVTGLYFLDILFGAYLVHKSLQGKAEIKISPEEIEKRDKKAYPMYTILCPLYKEWEMVPAFVKAMGSLDYPKSKLQVMLLLEEDDKETIKRVKAMDLPKHFSVVVVPHSLPKTKPKACNYGLMHAKGEYVVIYDAEDVPEKTQLKKAVIAFEQLPEKVVCVQAKLNYFNPHQNLLTRVFTAEYSLWFDLILTGLQSLSAPIPLGGTSNHFKREALERVKGWDSFNVTEDCDLGVRLAKLGLTTAIVESTTLEEANSDLKNWVNQRTRWIKGYIQTYFVHMRKSHSYKHRWSIKEFLLFQLIVGGKMAALFINPLMWITTTLYFAFRPSLGPLIEPFFPGPILYMGTASLVIGNFFYVYSYMIGCAKRGQYSLIKYAYLVPFYWLVMSYAAYRALWQLIFKPHYWSKTKHGLHLRITVRTPHKQWAAFWEWLLPVGNALNTHGKRTILIFNWRDTKHQFAGGAEVYIHELAKRWVEHGYHVILFCGRTPKTPYTDTIDGVHIVRRGGFYLVYFWAFVYYVLRFAKITDVVIDCENGVPFFTPFYAKKPIFLLIHHVHQEVFRKTLPTLQAAIAHFAEAVVMPLAYANYPFITISPSSREEIIRAGLTKKEPVILYPGVDLIRYKPGKKAVKPMVLYVGRLKHYKSVDVLLYAAQEVIKAIKTTPVRFVIAGDGEEKAKLMRLAKKLNIEKHVEFLGKVSEEEKIRLYQQAWVCVNPSFMEGWGITTIEANACGTPVIASHVGGLKDSVKDGVTGMLTPYGDAHTLAQRIFILIKDKKQRSAFSAQALAWAREFDWTITAHHSVALLENAISQYPPMDSVFVTKSS